MTTQTEAQRLADALTRRVPVFDGVPIIDKAAAELLRLDEEVKAEKESFRVCAKERYVYHVELAKAKARIAELEAANAALLDALKMNAQALSWLAFGECRGFTDNLPTALEATGAASAALKKHGGKS